MLIDRLIGGAGTGKTRAAIESLERAMERPEVAGNPFALGFSSFTRAARSEAAHRAGAAWGVDSRELEDEGWFKTVHAVAHKQLGIRQGELIKGSKEDVKWVSDAVGAEIEAHVEDGQAVYGGDSVASMALNLWGLARGTLRPLSDVCNEASAAGVEMEEAAEIIRRVEMYERAKRLEGRSDFSDLLSRFAGIRHDPNGGSEHCDPEGHPPFGVVGWIFDEAQDASALIDACCQRLMSGPDVLWCRLMLDPWQVLYGWAGASASHAMAYDVERQTIMPKSYRCAPPILELGERCISGLDDYFDRGIAPADHDGTIEESGDYEGILSGLDPRVDTLVLARTNWHAAKATEIMRRARVPHQRTKGKSVGRDVGMGGLWKLQHGQHVTSEEWTQALELLPAKGLFEHGAKAQWKKGLSDQFDVIYPEDLPALGCLPTLTAALATKDWQTLVDHGRSWYESAEKWGVEAVQHPRIRVGTIHSAKGLEASKVVYITSKGKRIAESESMSRDRWSEERRIEYVAVTRAKHSLVVLTDPDDRVSTELPLR
jgi:superfamily I DNA/RNA helicase